MNTELRRRLRWSARANVFVTVLGVTAAVYAVIVAQWMWMLAATVVVVGVLTQPVVLLASLLIAIVVGAWPAIVVASLGVLVEGGVRLQIRLAPNPSWGASALAARISVLPHDLRNGLESAHRRVDTSVLLSTAIERDPERWPFATALPPSPDNSEGGLVPGTCWTVIAAEAVLTASHYANGTGVVDVHLLAAVATLLPQSLARNVTVGGASSQSSLTAGGFTLAQLYDLVRWAITQPGGELLLSRMDLAVREKAPAPHQLMSDDDWRALGAPVDRGDDDGRG